MQLVDYPGLPLIAIIGLLAAIMVALIFEAVNGFHDAANAVATVIYTNSLRPRTAVLLSGACNFVGVYLGGVGVAFAVVHLLPVDLLVNVESRSAADMIFAILIAAIVWNVATWYRGIPASSSHTLIGAIMGVGLANGLIHDGCLSRGVNFGNAEGVFLSLLLSPILGFALAAMTLKVFRTYARDRKLYESPGDSNPPAWIRTILVLTCSGVSLAHGSNDGQKGVGLMMIILIGILPAQFALNPAYGTKGERDAVQSLEEMAQVAENRQNGMLSDVKAPNLGTSYRLMSSTSGSANTVARELEEIAALVNTHDCLMTVVPGQRSELRKKILLLEDHIKGMGDSTCSNFTEAEKRTMNKVRAELRAMTDYAPGWVILIVATAIGLGTMVGWKRVVVTVGERIGSSPLNYAQGASSELVAMITIGLADILALPVSTTHVLSSGVTGTMVANGVGLRYRTLRDIALAWILTLPVTIFLGGTLFLLFHLIAKI
ncbi:MAG TPA: inorganic phosphate transporter [Desulfomonilaceae bacterium]|nr:inorganic phosphate transporter [Desulfomonilaceae bacterium]